MSYTKGEWLPDIHNYKTNPKEIINGIKVEISPNYYQRIFDTILPDDDKDYIKEHDEISANVKLACASRDLLEALILLVDIVAGNYPEATDIAKEAMLDNIQQNLIELMADFLDSESVKLDEAIACISDPVPKDESELHIRMANAAFNEYKTTIINNKIKMK